MRISGTLKVGEGGVKPRGRQADFGEDFFGKMNHLAFVIGDELILSLYDLVVGECRPRVGARLFVGQVAARLFVGRGGRQTCRSSGRQTFRRSSGRQTCRRSMNESKWTPDLSSVEWTPDLSSVE